MHGRLGMIVLVAFGVLVADLAHGLGRLFFGLAAGLRPSRFSFGVGPVVAHTSRLVVRLFPLHLEANWRLDDQPQRLRLRLWMMTLGGLLGYVGVVAAVKACGVPLLHAAGALLPAQMIGTMAGLMLLGRALPMDLGGPDKPMPSDGLQLVRILRAERQVLIDALLPCVQLDFFELLRREQAEAALALCERGLAVFSAPTAPELRRLRCYALERLGRPAEAKAQAAANLDAAIRPEARWVVLNDWSWYAFCQRDEADLRLADARSAEALSQNPRLASVAGTRGAVLLWRGRVGEALPLLKRSVAGAKGPYGRVVNRCLLAIAHASRGESARAGELLEAARAEGKRDPLLDEARLRVEAAATSFRAIFAARGRRALLVEPAGVVLGEGVTGRPATRNALLAGARGSRVLSLSEIAAVRVGRSPRGRARLVIVAADGRSWRLPLAATDLMWARLLAEDILSPTRPALPLPKTPVRARDVAWWVIWSLGLLPIAALMTGFNPFTGLVFPPLLLSAGVMVLRPGAPAAFAFGTALLAKLAFAEGPLLDHVGALALALAALAAGVAARRRPRVGADGFGWAVGGLVLAAALEALAPVVLLLRGKADLAQFGPEMFVPPLVALAVVVLWGRRRVD